MGKPKDFLIDIYSFHKKGDWIFEQFLLKNEMTSFIGENIKLISKCHLWANITFFSSFKIHFQFQV